MDRSPSARVRSLAVAYLSIQGVALLAWWAVLLARPSARRAFVVEGAPDSTLLAFALGDLTLYAGTSFACAYGVLASRPWLRGALLVHAGAAGYGALYAVALAALEPSRWLGAAMMAPALVVPPWLVRVFRAREGRG